MMRYGRELTALDYSFWRILEILRGHFGYPVLPAPPFWDMALAHFGWHNVAHSALRAEIIFDDFWKWGIEQPPSHPLCELIATPEEISRYEERKSKRTPLPRLSMPEINNLATEISSLRDEGWKWSEIAEILGRPEASLKMLFARRHKR